MNVSYYVKIIDLLMSWGLSVLNTALERVFSGLNQLYAPMRSFSESVRKIAFFIFTLLTPPTWAFEPKDVFASNHSCSWGLSARIKAVLRMIVGSNQLYAPCRSFPESFRKIAFCNFTLPAPPTSRIWHMCVCLILSMFTESKNTDSGHSGSVAGF